MESEGNYAVYVRHGSGRKSVGYVWLRTSVMYVGVGTFAGHSRNSRVLGSRLTSSPPVLSGLPIGKGTFYHIHYPTE